MACRMGGRMKPSFMGRVAGFTVAMNDWIADGCPLRDPEETKELFETHCKRCPEMISAEGLVTMILPEGSGFCGECGCAVSADPTAVFNKVNKPQQGCPLGKWLPIVEIPEDG